MASGPGWDKMSTTMKAAADLSGDQYELCKVTADHTVNVSTAEGDISIGVIENNDADAAGKPVEVVWGRVKVKAAGTISAGDALEAASGGVITAGAATARAVGVALQGAASGDIFEALIIPSPNVFA